MDKTPVTVFSGYLGSGKTTIIMNALKQYATPQRFALIKNEFGDASVDGALATLNNLAVKELVNGCLCCILVGSLNEAINELIDTQAPQRIIIEASGNALPFPILLELKKNSRVYVDGVVSVIDCVNFEKIKDTSVVAREQAKHTNLIVFNKAGLVDDEKLYRVKEEVFGINPDTSKIETTDGIIDPAILFGIDGVGSIDGTEPARHDHALDSFTYRTELALNQTKVTEVLKACNASSFYRIKGIVRCDDGVERLVNGVFGTLTWPDLPPANQPTRIIFIGQNIMNFKTVIHDYLNKAV